MSNFKYLLTLPGILKLCSLISGLLVVALLSAAFDRGIWYHSVEGTDVVTGKTRTYNMETYCNDLRKDYEKRKDNGESDEMLGDEPRPCPQSLIIILSISFATIGWLTTTGMLVAYVIKDLNQSPKGKTIARVDTLIQVVGGLLFLVVMGISAYFNLTVTGSDFGRSNSNNCKKAPAIDRKAKGRRYSLVLTTPFNNCNELEERVFQKLLVYLGTGLALLAASLYLFAALLIYSRFVIHNERVMMVGAGQTVMMIPVQQQPSIQNSQQVSQVPQVPVDQATPSKMQTEIQAQQ